MKNLTNLDLGLSDDEDIPTRRHTRKPSRDESIGDLLADRDAAMMFDRGLPSRRGGNSLFDMSGGGADLMDAALSNYGRRGMPHMSPETMMTDEDREFELRFQQEMASSLGLGTGGFNDAASGRHSESPAVPPSVNGSNESMSELMGDILDDAPKKPPTARSRSSAPSSTAEDTRPAPRRLASPGIGSFADSRGTGTPPVGRDYTANDSDLLNVELDTRRSVPPRRLASPGLGSVADSRGSATPLAKKDTYGVNDSDSFGFPAERGPPLQSALDVELKTEVKPRRKLGGPKAKPSPAPSSRALEEEAPSLGRTTPQPQSGRASPAIARTRSPPVGSSQQEAATLASSQTEARPPSALGSAHFLSRQVSREEGPSEEEENVDDDDLDDLLQDNTQRNPTPAAPPPETTNARDAKEENSDDGLPDFLMNRNRGPRRGQGNVASTLPKSTGFDLGFAEEDLDKSDQSGQIGSPSSPVATKPTSPRLKSTSPLPGRSQQNTERLGLGTGLLDVPLNVERNGRNLAKAKPKAKEKPTVPMHLGMDSAPPSVQGDVAFTPGLPRPELPRAYQPADGLPPGSPLTQTAQSESGSLHPRQRPETMPTYAPRSEPVLANAYRPEMQAHSLAPSSVMNAPAVANNTHRSVAQKGVEGEGVGVGSPGGSDPNLSLFGPEPGQYDIGGRAFAGFSEFPPLAAAPSQDLLSKLAYSEAKVRHLQLQLEDSELRMRERLESVKKQHESELEKMELQNRRLEAELDRCKDIHKGDLEHLNTSKQLLLQNFDMEKEEVRRDERRKSQLELEKMKIDHDNELEELRRRHERNLSIAKQQAEMEAENLKRAQSGEHHLTKLVEQVQGSVAEVERMSRRVDSDKSVEWSVRERQLEAREKQVRDMESRLSAQSKEVEDQRRRVSELVRHMESSQVDDRESLKLERERLQDEHGRLLALQQSVREADRNNKEALKHAWSQLEDERHSFKQDHLRFESDAQAQRDEAEIMERQHRQETDRLKAIHNQVEVARQNASRRIRETEATIANERRVLMSELEIFEEKRRNFAAEMQQFEDSKNRLGEDRSNFDQEVKAVGQMAAEVERRSEELRCLHDQATEARSQILRLRDQLHEERNVHSTEEERLKTMQALVEQQRLQLLQTENQLRIRGIEDIDLLVTTQATFPGNVLSEPGFNPIDFGQAFPPLSASPQDPAAVMTAANMAAPFASSPGFGSAGGVASQISAPVLSKSVLGASGAAGTTAYPRVGSSRMELQTLLRKTKEQGGGIMYIQEQLRFLQEGTRQDENLPFSDLGANPLGFAGFEGGSGTSPAFAMLPSNRVSSRTGDGDSLTDY